MIRYLATTLALATLWFGVTVAIIDAAVDAAVTLSVVRVGIAPPDEER